MKHLILSKNTNIDLRIYKYLWFKSFVCKSYLYTSITGIIFTDSFDSRLHKNSILKNKKKTLQFRNLFRYFIIGYDPMCCTHMQFKSTQHLSPQKNQRTLSSIIPSLGLGPRTWLVTIKVFLFFIFYMIPPIQCTDQSPSLF